MERLDFPDGPSIHVTTNAPARNDAVGSLALRKGGGAGSSLYVKEAAGTSGWVAVTTTGTPGPALVGSVWAPLSALPTTSTWTANLLSLTAIYIPVSCTITGLQVPNGGTATGNLLAALWSADGATLLGSSASTAQSGTFVTQLVPFSATVAVTPGAYLMGLIPSSSSATFVQINGWNPAASAAQGGFTVPSTVTPPSASARIYSIATATY